ncbi:MAG: hypothetical protein ACXAC7_06605 [Candidatus Hodarchaeales archaeon]|jgi:hypothetical protein
MLKDAANNTSIEIPTSLLAFVLIALAILALGLLSFSALGSATFLF